MKQVEIFDALDLPGDLWDAFCVHHEAGNDTIHKWYPYDVATWDEDGYKGEGCMSVDQGKAINAWLLFNGATFEPKYRQGLDEFFFVLFEVSW